MQDCEARIQDFEDFEDVTICSEENDNHAGVLSFLTTNGPEDEEKLSREFQHQYHSKNRN